MLSNKIRENKEFSFRAVLIHIGLSNVGEKVNSDLKFKGKMLMGLK
jgi:hypothetical protein